MVSKVIQPEELYSRTAHNFIGLLPRLTLRPLGKALDVRSELINIDALSRTNPNASRLRDSTLMDYNSLLYIYKTRSIQHSECRVYII